MFGLTIEKCRFLWKKTIRAGSWLSQATGGWGFLSRSWRFIAEEKYKQYPLKKYRSIGELEQEYALATYESDNARLGDTISYPGAIQYRIDNKFPLGDCDDYAEHAATILGEQFSFRTLILAVQWVVGWKIHGHAVCIFLRPDGWYMIGNWYGGRRVGPFPSYSDVAKRIVQDAGGEIISFAIFDRRTLENISFHPQV